MKKQIMIAICLLFFYKTGWTQNSVKTAAITADSLASGNYKDVLTSFFQLAFDKLTSKEKEFKFSSNPYAIMMRADPELALDQAYVRHRFLRNTNFNFGLKLDTGFHFNGFNSGIKIAIINRRDETVYKEFVQAVNNKNEVLHQFVEAVGIAASGLPDELQDKVINEANSLFGDEKFLYSNLSSAVKPTIDAILAKPEFAAANALLKAKPAVSFRTQANNNYDSLKKLFQNRLLWTANVTDTTYKDNFMFSNIVLSTQLLKGVTNPDKRSNIEIDVRAAFNFLDDTTRKGRDLKRGIFKFEPGFNWVLKSRSDKPMLELKFNGSYRYVVGNLYKKETRDRIDFNATIRVRIIADIWVPLQITYDPKSGNLLGFMNVRFNFNGQGKK